MKFCNSRMFPGQVYRTSASIVSEGMSAITESLELLFLQDAQQFRLKLQRDVADFVKKERALVRELKAARLFVRPLR
jgi:hypothetical protein